MAQIVKKLQQGGSFMLDGQRVEATDENLLKLAEVSPEAAELVKSGRSISINSDGNGTITYTGDALRGRDKRRLRRSLSNMGSLNFTPTVSSSATPAAQKHKLDASDEINLEFDSNGKLLNTPAATKYKKRLAGYLSGWKNLGKEFSEYDFGDKFASIDEANAYWDSVKQHINDDFYTRIANGEATEQDIAYLKAAGINYGAGASESAQNKKAALRAQQDLGLTEDQWNLAKDFVAYDDKHKLYTLNESALKSLGISDLNRGYEFNDSFQKYANNPRWSWLKGFSLVGGNLYKTNDSAIDTWLGNTTFKNHVDNSDIESANKIYQYTWGNDAAQHIQRSHDNGKYWHPFFGRKGNENLKFQSLTGTHVLSDEAKQSLGLTDDNYQIIKYFDKNAARDRYGNVSDADAKYGIFDSIGNEIKFNNETVGQNLTKDQLESMLDRSKSGAWRDFTFGEGENSSQYNRIKDETSPYNGMIVAAPSNVNSGIRVFYDPTDPTKVILNTGWDKKTASKGKAFRVPKELAALIHQDPEGFVKKLAENSDIQRRLTRSLNDMGTSAWAEFFDWSNRMDIKDYRRLFENLGIDRKTARTAFRQVQELGDRTINDAGDSSRIGKEYAGQYMGTQARRDQWFVDNYKNPQSHKNGGVLKAAKGAQLVETGPIFDDSVQQGLSEKGIKDMSGADWAEVGALVADIGALGATFIPGVGNIASAGIGAAGSTAAFAADIARDGFQGSDLGGYALNLLMDAGTLIPGVGSAAKASKIGKMIKKAAPLLIKAASVAGVADATVNTIKKIANGESFTINDIRKIVNGLSAGIALHKTGILTPGKTTKSMKQHMDIKPTSSNTPSVRLKKSEMESIAKLAPEKQMDALSDLLLNKVKVKTPNTTLTKDTILQEFNIPTNSKWGFSWNPTKWKTDTPDFTTPDPINWKGRTDRNAFSSWWHGDDPARIAYNRWLREGVAPVRSKQLPADNFWRKYFNIGKNGHFIKGTIPGISLPSIAPHTEETDPSTFADAYIIAHKKGGKVKKYETGDSLMEDYDPLAEEDIIHDSFEDTSDLNTTNYNTLSGKGNFLGNVVKYSSPELAGNIANFAQTLKANRIQKESDIESAEISAQKTLIENTPIRKNIPLWDQSNLDRGLERNRQTIYNQPLMSISDPNLDRQYRLQQAQMMTQVNNQYNDSLSEQYSKYKNNVEDIIHSNFERDQKFGLLSKSLGKGVEYAKVKANAAEKLANTQSLMNLTKDLATRTQRGLDQAKQVQMLAEQYNAESQLYNDAVNEWDRLVNAGQIDEAIAKKYGTDILSYMQTERPEWYSNTSAKYRGNALQNSVDNNMWSSFIKIPNMISRHLPSMPSAPSVTSSKKGGKLSTYDRLWLMQNKETAKTVAKLRDEVLDLIKITK